MRFAKNICSGLLVLSIVSPVFAEAPASAPAMQPTSQPTSRPTSKPAPLTPEQQELQRKVDAQDPALPAIKVDKDGNPNAIFMKKHESFLDRAKEPMDLLFLGDSITEGWGKAKELYHERYDQYKPANFGIGGDRTQHVLWRIEHGELDGISPKVVVLMIGTNNTPTSAEAPDIARGVTAIVNAIKQKLPNTKVLLLGIFPRAAKPDSPLRIKNKAANEIIAKLDDGGKTVRYLDFGDKFLDENGVLPKSIMPDALHPNAESYKIWADAMQQSLDEMITQHGR